MGRGNMNFNKNKTVLTTAIQTALLGILTTSGAVIAQDKIETITVTANRAAQSSDNALASQQIITRADIEKVKPHSVLDLLRSVAGLDFSQQGSVGQQSSVFIRGANANHTLVLLDGIRLSSATLGTTELQTISPSQIERIEVVKGPRAAIWGSAAIGGVIQIFTRQLSPNDVELGLQVGADNLKKARVSAAFSHGDGSSTITINREKSDGFDVLTSAEDDKDGYDYLSLALKGQQRLSQGFSIDYLVQKNTNESEYDNAYGGNNEAETDNYAWFTRANYEIKSEGVVNFTTVTFGQNKDDNHQFKKGSAAIFDSVFETNRDQFSVLNHSVFDQPNSAAVIGFTVGADYHVEAIDSSTAYVNEDRTVFGFFAQSRYEQESYNFEFALRYDEVEDLDSETSFNLAGGVNLSDAIKLVASAGSGFKTPTFNDLYFPADPYSAGNPDLKAERSESAELSLQYKQQQISASLNVYKTDIDNLIEWQADANFLFQPQNLAEVNIQGVEAVVQYWGDWGSHSINLTVNESINAATDKQLIRRSKQHFNYSFNTALGATDLLVEYQYKGKSYDEDFILGRINLGSYSLLNIALSYPITDNLEITGRVSNALDEDYQTAFNYNSPSQKWYLGVNYQL